MGHRLRNRIEPFATGSTRRGSMLAISIGVLSPRTEVLKNVGVSLWVLINFNKINFNKSNELGLL